MLHLLHNALDSACRAQRFGSDAYGAARHRRIPRPRWVATALGLVLLLMTGQADAGDIDDTVFLKSGGRARGTVIEEDPRTGVTLRLPNNTLRTFKPDDVARVEYGTSPATESSMALHPSQAQGASAAVAPPVSDTPFNVVQGSLRIESSEPGSAMIDGAEYGTLPQVIQNLSAGPHRVVVQFHAGDSIARIIGVRAGTETLAKFEPTPSLEAFKSHHGLHFGVGVDPLIALVDGDDLGASVRVFGRMSYAFTRVVELRVDLVGGGYVQNVYRDYNTATKSAFGVSLRGDLQLNWGSIYTLAVGLDFGVAATDEEGPFIGGVHVSLLGFRFGSKREFLLSAQEGLMSVNGRLDMEQTLGLSYLFL